MNAPSLQSLVVTALLLPFVTAFAAILWPGVARSLALLACVVTGALGWVLWTVPVGTPLALGDAVGVSLAPDALAAPFLVLNALVTLAVLIAPGSAPDERTDRAQILILHGGLSSAFVCADLISLYVSLEVVSIAAFLLVVVPRRAPLLWIALRYLLVSNTAMLFFLLGCARLYLGAGSFRMADAAGASAPTLALLLVGLLTKSGLFVSGLWLPRTHAEAPPRVSALLSGVVVAGGAAPLLRLAQEVPALPPLLLLIGGASALTGVVAALVETDLKRLLAWSTLSQLGFVVAWPPVGAFYALCHGLAKAALFLLTPRFPSRDLAALQRVGVPWPVWALTLAASLSIVGVPPFAGYVAKSATLTSLAATGLEGVPLEWLFQAVAVGTAAVFLRLWTLPCRGVVEPLQGRALIAAMLPLLLPLLLLGTLSPAGFSPIPALDGLSKLMLTLAAALLLHLLRGLAPGAGRWLSLRFPWERLDDLIGSMALVLAAVVIAR